ncbi:MAG: protein translocase subunit SecF [Oceanococcus sp.]
MRLFSKPTNYNFMGMRKQAAVLSLVLVVLSAAVLLTRGLNFGIDFTGGVLVEVAYPESVELDSVREVLAANGFEDAVAQYFGASNDVLIRLPPSESGDAAQLSNQVYAALKADGAEVDLRRVEFVGPQVGEELTVDGGLAMIWALGCIFLYIVFRFHWKFSAGAVAALVHDVMIVLGAFSLLRIEFDLSVLAAVLAVIGYSLNDTIVVFDRCRENYRRKGGGTEVEVMNRSINEMLSRTLMTSVTTLLVLLALYLLGGKALSGFSLALIIGVVVGTYSSIYVAGNASLSLGLRRDELIPPPPTEDLDDNGAQV